MYFISSKDKFTTHKFQLTQLKKTLNTTKIQHDFDLERVKKDAKKSLKKKFGNNQ